MDYRTHDEEIVLSQILKNKIPLEKESETCMESEETDPLGRSQKGIRYEANYLVFYFDKKEKEKEWGFTINLN